MTHQPVPFFDSRIRIKPHTTTIRHHLGRTVSIEQFAQHGRVSLTEVVETGEYIVRRADGAFIQGPEV